MNSSLCSEYLPSFVGIFVMPLCLLNNGWEIVLERKMHEVIWVMDLWLTHIFYSYMVDYLPAWFVYVTLGVPRLVARSEADA